VIASARSAPAKSPSEDEASLAVRCRIEPVVLDGVLPELCPALEQIILRRSKAGRSTKSLNVGGWKSAEDFFLWPDDAVQQLRQWIVSQAELRVASLVGWAMVNRAGSHHPRHQHRVATLTGIYYVTPGSEDAITPTIFECKTGDLEVDPHPGRLVICRGETWHRVPSYPGELPRITIAFDVRR
jgi:hypothetical protein